MVLEAIDFYGMSDGDILKYLPMKDCGRCGKKSCAEFAAALSKGEAGLEECQETNQSVLNSLAGVLTIRLEVREADEKMTAVPEPLIPVNNPTSDSPVILTGNSAVTIMVLKMIFDKAPDVSAWILPTDSKGYTADHMMPMNLLTPMAVSGAITRSGVVSKVSSKILIIPGLCEGADIRKIEMMTRWKLVIGPRSGFELPAYISSGVWKE